MNLDDPALIKQAQEYLGIQQDKLRAFLREAERTGGKKCNTYYTLHQARWMCDMLEKFHDLGTDIIALNSSETSMSPNTFYQRCRYALTYIQDHKADFPPAIAEIALRTKLRRHGVNVELHLKRNVAVAPTQPDSGVTVYTARQQKWDQLCTGVQRYIEAGHVTGRAFVQVAELDLTDEEQQKIKEMVPAGFVCAIAKGRNIVITKRKE